MFGARNKGEGETCISKVVTFAGSQALEVSKKLDSL